MEVNDRKVSSVSTRKFNIEEERLRMLKQLDIDNYSLSRIPRPDEKPNPNSQPNTNKLTKSE